MSFLGAILAVIIPTLPLIIPGAFIVRIRAWENLLATGARVILWSLGILTIVTTAGLYIGVSVTTSLLFVVFLGAIRVATHPHYFFSRKVLWYFLGILIPFAFIGSIFAIPFLAIHDGLPTGDVQKTIIWANDIISNNALPDYARAITFLNRDPVDFYTPGLHAISALVLSLSPFPLTSIGFFSILIAIGVAWVAAAITKELFDGHAHVVPPIIAALLTLTQLRFLRYLREPGYHFQNVVGELFLFGMVFLFIRFMRKREKQDALLFIVCGAALFLSHQFSAFIAVFMIAGMLLATVIQMRIRIIHAVREHVILSGALGALCVTGLIIAASLGLGAKIPSIFTTTPHLASSLPTAIDYPALMGSGWFFVGVVGALLMLIESRRKDAHRRQVVSFVAGIFVLLLLSQGPAIGIDIPPVRALFYLAAPLSIAGAYFISKLFFVAGRTYHGYTKIFAQGGIILAVCSIAFSSTQLAYGSLSHTVRTNSTLTGEQLASIEQLQGASTDSAILVDDYSRRSASWLVLSGRPMFTRIASDLERQMEESSQSPLRKELYIRQLDYEKIINLASLPEIAPLLSRNSIGYIVGTSSTSVPGLSRNPLLDPIAIADDATIFAVKNTDASSCLEKPACAFLMRSTTLANDIGDGMDTFEHLPASIQSPRLSNPLATEQSTYRETTSPIIPLLFNVGDYVRVLWDPSNVGRPETTLTLMIRLVKPIQNATLLTSSGERLPLPYSSDIAIELPQSMVHINERGFVSLSILNPNAELVGIDLVALGPSLVP